MPAYLQNETEATILARMLAAVPSIYDTSQGSTIWDMISPAAAEMYQANIYALQVLKMGFAQTSWGQWLDYRAGEHGIIRKVAVAATGTVTYSGTVGTVIPAGSRVSTASTDTQPAIVFKTNASATVGSGGTIDVAVTAVTAGAPGNVIAAAVKFITDKINGLTGVLNAAAMTGGLDAETDAALLARYLQRVQSPSAGGNKADYINWALAVSGVGGVAVVPVRDGAGTVSVAIIDTNAQPATQTLIDSTQNYIAPPWVTTVDAEGMTLGGYGASIDTTQTTATDGAAVKMTYSASGAGTITEATVNNILQQAGIWTARLSVRVDSVAGANNLLQIGMWNVSANAWCNTTSSSGVAATTTVKASNLTTAFADVLQQFYWNGVDQIQLQVTRLAGDTTTTVWVDRVTYRSAFSQVNGAGLAPIGAKVTVQSATAHLINVSATMQISSGFNVSSVQAAAQAAVVAYLKTAAFGTVLYSQVGLAIQTTTGVVGYTNLLVNSATNNVVMGAQEVPVIGTVTWS